MRRDITVVKLGGSLAFSPHLDGWLATIEACAGHVVMVPGGGPFADVVRDAQNKMGFADDAAHRMALLAMEQFGCALVSRGRKLTQAATAGEIERVLAQRQVPVWSPARMVLAAEDIPASWDMTSDSLAAWLAGKIEAPRLLLVKQGDFGDSSLHADELARRDIVDPLLPRFLAASRAKAAVIGTADHELAAAVMARGLLPGAPIDLP